ncbi:hypothetical protein [Bradyrhizobium commune]|uniref:Uncharacterized protein n=1 Tax=Bradyrhizobium commune TaxID=83627 RepID=A0A7S9D0Q7_9BRAD|nr:hypothetical protein [Bradyrhizobium commune]QPF89032.1 hypothetical protein IC761_21205 [Bradyrhizobium commune]
MKMLLKTISVLPFEREDARMAAQLRASVNSQGTSIGAYDVLFAAPTRETDGFALPYVPALRTESCRWRLGAAPCQTARSVEQAIAAIA